MEGIVLKSSDDIPEQQTVPWSTAFVVSWAGLGRRLGRSVVTMVGVVLAIAFLTYMLVTDAITSALLQVNDDRLSVLLQQHGVDVFSAGQPDRMMILLIILALITCLVGIVNAMLMSVTERVREIGTLKCLGALDLFILQTYFIESSLMGILGTLIGMGLGFLVSLGIGLLSYRTYVLTHFSIAIGGIIQSMVIALLIGILLSIVASIAPAYWAAKKQPVEALRVEE